MVGSPIAHSLSPALHRAAYAHLGLGWTYEARTVERDQMAAFVDSLDATWRGLSVTMPLKQAAVEVASVLVDPVPALGVANTLVLEGDVRTALNTDVPGMRAALVEAGCTAVPSATVLGGGATARAAVAALAPLASQVVACVRAPTRAAHLAEVAERVGVRLILAPWESTPAHLRAPLVVSTTPAGVTDGWAREVPPGVGTLFDVVYDPWPTALAAAWARSGGQVLSGLDLLVHQALGQVEAMTGHTVPLAVLRQAVAS